MDRFADYLQAICQVNGLTNGLKIQWCFHTGMLFLSRDKWWGDFKYRASAHEGIDITYFKTDSHKIRHFDNTIKVPAMGNGIILNICNDFLGQTLVVEDKKNSSPGWRVILTYSHIVPFSALKKGDHIKKQDIIAQVCDTYKNPELPAHLHFSCFGIPDHMSDHKLNWDLFSNPGAIQMINPVFL